MDIIRKHRPQPISKSIVGRMFDLMLPCISRKLRLSNMNMFGVGPKLICGIMKKHNVALLEELIQNAVDQGV
ncbi:DsrE/DsrF/DrsH-like family protein [Paenibacillus sp. FSL L8-0158]|uniref:DsrE/DsrF/DrsH-like family protein n=1 Tax=Paenibacillus sp. FSL L8-0158 TaxID=2954752 RepID=UPI003158601B